MTGIRRLLALTAVAGGALALAPVGAPAVDPSCSFDAARREVTLRGTGLVRIAVDASGRIVAGPADFGADPRPCGRATTRATDRVVVRPLRPDEYGRTYLYVDLSRPFEPGATAEPGGRSEIELEVAVRVAEPGPDRITFVTGAADDTLTLGTAGLDVNGDGDVDVTFDHDAAHTPYVILSTMGGDDHVSGQGGHGTGAAWPFTLELYGDEGSAGGGGGGVLEGGDAVDAIWGYDGQDVIRGHGGDDDLFGGGGRDDVAGGAGEDFLGGDARTDRLAGDEGDDVLNAQGDGRRPLVDQVDGGPGNDCGIVDAIDRLTSVERVPADPGRCFSPRTHEASAAGLPGPSGP